MAELTEKKADGPTQDQDFMGRPGDITENPAFQAWFQGSKVVDDHGRPLRVYHGTRGDFHAFDPEADPISAESDRGYFFFTDNTEDASGYASTDGFHENMPGANVMPVYLALKNPETINVGENSGYSSSAAYWYQHGDEVGGDAKANGRDGVILHGHDGTTYVAFSPNQIKSAIGNSGEFGPKDKRITAATSTISYILSPNGNVSAPGHGTHPGLITQLGYKSGDDARAAGCVRAIVQDDEDETYLLLQMDDLKSAGELAIDFIYEIKPGDVTIDIMSNKGSKCVYKQNIQPGRAIEFIKSSCTGAVKAASKTAAYTAYVLTNEARQLVLKTFPPKFPDVIAHHVTVDHPAKKDTPLPAPATIRVEGYSSDESLEALVVSVDGQTTRPDGEIYHITLSLDKSRGRKPVDSKSVIKANGWTPVETPFDIQVIPQKVAKTVYHGTPHEFDSFDTDHIGEGEGARVYGWGLYFTDSKDVAEYYRQALVGTLFPPRPDFFTVDGVSYAREGGVFSKGSGEVINKEEYGKAFQKAQKDYEHNLKTKGKLYEATIPEDNTMLLWDKPLSQQPEFVRKVLASEIENVRKDAEESSPEWGDLADPDKMEAYVTGDALYRTITNRLGSDKAASEYLYSLGIKGIKYLDGKSRSAGEGTHNYVIFSNSDVTNTKTASYSPLQEDAQDAREKVFGGGPARNGDCEPTADALYDILISEGQDASIAYGFYKNAPHSWVHVGDTYIDPTHDQFGEPDIRVGKITDRAFKRDYTLSGQRTYPKTAMKPKVIRPDITLYRGEGPGATRNGRFWSPDMEFAKQFTQSGLESELLVARIPASEIYKATNLPYGGDFDVVDAVAEIAKAKGYTAVWCNEGGSEQNSVYVFNPSKLHWLRRRKYAAPTGFDINDVKIQRGGRDYSNTWFATWKGKRIGWATLGQFGEDELAKDERCIWKSNVLEEYRRAGVATKLYDAVEEYCKTQGWKLVASPPRVLSEDAFGFWKKRNPETLKADSRTWNAPYIGKELQYKGNTVRLTSLSDKGGVAEFLVPQKSTTSWGQEVEHTTTWVPASVVFEQLGSPKIAPSSKAAFVRNKKVRAYHGTTQQFDTFETPAMFHVHRKYCEDLIAGQPDGHIVEAILTLQNPADLDTLHLSPSDPKFKEMAKSLEEQGYDGAQYRHEAWIAFKPEQIQVINSKTAADPFKSWFGKSKVVDANGQPLKLYHGTNQNFDMFSEDRRGGNTNNTPATMGFWFTDHPGVASEYADMAGRKVIHNVEEHEKKFDELMKKVEQAERRQDWDAYEKYTNEMEAHELDAIREEPKGMNVMPVYLRIINPKVVDVNGSFLNMSNSVADTIQKAKAGGHDGLIFKQVDDSPDSHTLSDHYVVWNANQIKSALGNSGKFDKKNLSVTAAVKTAKVDEPIKTAASGFLYHGTSSAILKQIFKNGDSGVLNAPNYWGTQRIAESFAEATCDEKGGTPVVFKLPIGNFDQSAFELDQHIIEEPDCFTLNKTTETLYSEWERVEGDGTWQDCLRIYEAVVYMKPMPVTKDDFDTVWSSHRAASDVLYHVTETVNVSSIMEKGLLRFQTSNWVTGKKQRYGKGEIYAMTNEFDAIRWAAHMDWEFNKATASGKISIVRFKRGDEKWEVDTNDPMSQAGARGQWLKCDTPIPASQIIDAKPITREQVQRLVKMGARSITSQTKLYHGTSMYGIVGILKDNAIDEGVHWGRKGEPHGVRFTRSKQVADGFAVEGLGGDEGAVIELDAFSLARDYKLVDYVDVDCNGDKWKKSEKEVVAVTPKVYNIRKYITAIYLKDFKNQEAAAEYSLLVEEEERMSAKEWLDGYAKLMKDPLVKGITKTAAKYKGEFAFYIEVPPEFRDQFLKTEVK